MSFPELNRDCSRLGNSNRSIKFVKLVQSPRAVERNMKKALVSLAISAVR